MAELTGRFELLAAQASELQRPEHHDVGRVVDLRREAKATLRLIDAVLILRSPTEYRQEDQESLSHNENMS